MRDESCKSWNNLHSTIDYIDVKEQIYLTTDLLTTEKLQLQFIFKILLPRVTKKKQDCISEFLLTSPALAKFHTFERQHSSKCFPGHIIPGNFEISEILKVRIYQSNLRWLLLISIKDRSNNFLFILAIERVRWYQQETWKEGTCVTSSQFYW